MDVTRDGLWLIGVGSALLVVAQIIGAERPQGGISFSGRFTTLRDRLYFTVERLAS